jgi:hypothetical protein
MEEDLPTQWPLQTGRNSNTYIRQSRLQIYIGQIRQRRTLHTNKRDNKSKGNNNYQPMHPMSVHTISSNLH